MLDRDKVEAVLFDLDGTLMDTDDQAVEALQHRLERLRWTDPPRTARRLIMASETPGNWLMTVLDVLGLDSPLMSFTSQLRRWRGLRNVGHFRIVEGAEEMLAALQGRYRLGIVTTRGATEAEAFVDQYHLHGVFEVVVTRESTWRLKPHPAPVLHAAQLLTVPAERCVMVGDTTVDIRSARRAGAWAVAVLCGFGERKELERSGAHIVLEHTAHLASLL
jgi:HAD superfamily hydrolase (TIGR01549 family)